MSKGWDGDLNEYEAGISRGDGEGGVGGVLVYGGGVLVEVFAEDGLEIS